MPDVVHVEPSVDLVSALADPYRLAIAAARTCYSPHIITPDQVTAGQMERIGPGVFSGGHHTVFQHATFCFAISGVSRQFVWASLHSHPFYNSEQTSQRYVVHQEPRVVNPGLDGPALKVFDSHCLRAWETYRHLNELLFAALSADRVLDRRKAKALEKKCIEIGRYALPLATHTQLYHTVSGLTLFRMLQTQNQPPVAFEGVRVFARMRAVVESQDPTFFQHLSSPPELAAMPEGVALGARNGTIRTHGDPGFAARFDAQLDGHTSKLVAYLPEGQALMIEAAREVIGGSDLSDEAILELLLDPRSNGHLAGPLNVGAHSPLTRALNIPQFVFKKRLSHTADSQEQRHRTLPAARPLLHLSVTDRVDVITPELVSQVPEAAGVYADFMAECWEDLAALENLGVDRERAIYILPNAVAVRYTQHAPYLHLWHKLRLRLCHVAQREIWRVAVEEYQQVATIFPDLMRYVGPNCLINCRAQVRPFCTEGDRWCQLPVWTYDGYSLDQRTELR